MNTASQIKQAGVAGTFYPSDRDELKTLLQTFFEQARQEQTSKITTHFKAMVIPHAGYKYSGLTAAHAYKFFNPAKFNKVIVLGPSHKKPFEGLAVHPQISYETPLGLSPRQEIDPHAGITLSEEVFEGEHSVEVHLPFIQYRLLEEHIDLEKYPITLLLYGNISPSKLAKKLEHLIDDKTFVVLSSDLSHYHDIETAKMKDEQAIEAILSGNPKDVLNIEACGRHGISAFLQTKFSRSYKPEFIHYSNSASSSGDNSRVVGYCAIAFAETQFQNYKRSDDIMELNVFADPKKVLNDDCKAEIFSCLRASLEEFLTNKTIPDFTHLSNKYPFLNEEAASFVTFNLASTGHLRGCIGSLTPHRSLLQDIVVNAIRAATEDTRFKPLTVSELADVKIEISILETPKFLRCKSEFDLLNQIEPRKHGVIVQQGNKRATFLPQVWEKFHKKTDFMAQLCKKAGLKEDAWRIAKEKVQIFLYEVSSFHEA